MARDLLAAKVTASRQTDGLEVRSTLQSLGVTDDEEDAITLAMSMGQGIYQRLSRGYSPARRTAAVIEGEVIQSQGAASPATASVRPLDSRPTVLPPALLPRRMQQRPSAEKPAMAAPRPLSTSCIPVAILTDAESRFNS